MRNICELLKKRMDAGRDSVLAVIAEASGSLPRKTGAYMLIGEEGICGGTIGGGALEYKAVQEAQELLRSIHAGLRRELHGVLSEEMPTQAYRFAQKGGVIHSYDLSNSDAAGLGMVCGGRASVLFYPVQASEADDRSFADAVLEAETARRPYRLFLPVGPGKAYIRITEGPEESLNDTEPETATDYEKLQYETNCTGMKAAADHAALMKNENETTQSGFTDTAAQNGRMYYMEQFEPEARVFLFGAGHLAQETVPLLSHLGFRCLVFDDRSEFAAPERFPLAEQTSCIDFSALAAQTEQLCRKQCAAGAPSGAKSCILPLVSARDYILVMTRGHLGDTDVLRFALGTPACYIGAVGSRKKAAFVREQLLCEGFSEAALARIVSPVGLAIGGDTPEEIAVSIAAQLIQVRARRPYR